MLKCSANYDENPEFRHFWIIVFLFSSMTIVFIFNCMTNVCFPHLDIVVLGPHRLHSYIFFLKPTCQINVCMFLFHDRWRPKYSTSVRSWKTCFRTRCRDKESTIIHRKWLVIGIHCWTLPEPRQIQREVQGEVQRKYMGVREGSTNTVSSRLPMIVKNSSPISSILSSHNLSFRMILSISWLTHKVIYCSYKFLNFMRYKHCLVTIV